MNGVELIAAERERQIEEEGWTDEHDDGHNLDDLAKAAAVYAMPQNRREFYTYETAAMWPWDEEWFKPTPDDRVRELVKAGALIAAEIDRLQREDA